MRRALDAADNAEAQRAAAEDQAAALRSQLEAATAAQQRLSQVEGALQTGSQGTFALQHLGQCQCGLCLYACSWHDVAGVPGATQGWLKRR